MSFSRPIQWYHSHADPIWPDGTFDNLCANAYLSGPAARISYMDTAYPASPEHNNDHETWINKEVFLFVITKSQKYKRYNQKIM